VAYWAVAQLHQERLAMHYLEQVAGFEIYSPRIKAPRNARRQGPRPLFPGYLFVVIELQWHAASRAPGVIRLVLDGGMPAKVPDEVIRELRGRERNGLVRLPEPPCLRTGARIRVIRGPLNGLEGLVAGTRPGERIEILLGLLGKARATLPVANVEPV
jgi:transcriptional antiterminator RfaH